MPKNPATKPIPDGFHTVTPHLTVSDAAKAIEFYKAAFGADELQRCQMDGGPILHASIAIGDSVVMLNDEFPDHGSLGPQNGQSSVTIHLYVEDADAWFERAKGAGAEVVFPIENTFWGDRFGLLCDPFGHRWAVATRQEDLTPEETMERAAAVMGSGPAEA